MYNDEIEIDEEAENLIKTIEENITPFVYFEKNGIRFQDLNRNLCFKALKFLKREYFPGHHFWSICSNLEIDEICSRYLTMMKDNCSLVALDEKNNIVGLVIARIMTSKDNPWTYWKYFPTKSENIANLSKFDFELVKSANKETKAKNPLHIFLICCVKSFKGKLFKEELLAQTSKMAQMMRVIDGISWICYTNNDRERAERVGMELIAQKNYGEFNGTSFTNFKSNYSAFLYFIEI